MSSVFVVKEVGASIHGVFTDSAVADQAGVVLGGIVEQKELDPPVATSPLLEAGWRRWLVEFDAAGAVSTVTQRTLTDAYALFNEGGDARLMEWMVYRKEGGESGVELLAQGALEAEEEAAKKRDYALNKENELVGP